MTEAITVHVGDRVTIPKSKDSGVGIVRFVGQTQFSPGIWVGIELSKSRT